MTPTQPPACGKISEERLREMRAFYAPRELDAFYSDTAKAIVRDIVAIIDELLSHRHPAPVADERAEVALLAANVVLREFVTSVQRSGATERQLQAGARHALDTVEKIERAALSAQPSGALEREKCAICDNTGDMHRADGEYLGECPDCAPPERAPGKKLSLSEAVEIARGRADPERDIPILNAILTAEREKAIAAERAPGGDALNMDDLRDARAYFEKAYEYEATTSPGTSKIAAGQYRRYADAVAIAALRLSRASTGADATLRAALELHRKWEALPIDRGGARGPKGRAYAAFIAARDAALAGNSLANGSESGEPLGIGKAGENIRELS